MYLSKVYASLLRIQGYFKKVCGKMQLKDAYFFKKMLILKNSEFSQHGLPWAFWRLALWLYQIKAKCSIWDAHLRGPQDRLPEMIHVHFREEQDPGPNLKAIFIQRLNVKILNYILWVRRNLKIQFDSQEVLKMCFI